MLSLTLNLTLGRGERPDVKHDKHSVCDEEKKEEVTTISSQSQTTASVIRDVVVLGTTLYSIVQHYL